jgi:hypothetical protein
MPVPYNAGIDFYRFRHPAILDYLIEQAWGYSNIVSRFFPRQPTRHNSWFKLDNLRDVRITNRIRYFMRYHGGSAGLPVEISMDGIDTENIKIMDSGAIGIDNLLRPNAEIIAEQDTYVKVIILVST